ncbi:MAG: glycosyltransferase family 4 protein [Candidatus Omnitrophota bacterium]
MRKILLLVPFDIFPPFHGSGRLVYDLLKCISSDNRIHLLLTRIHSQNTNGSPAQEGISVEYCPRSILDRLKMPSLLFNPLYFKAAERMMRDSHCDLIQCETIYSVFAGILMKMKFKKPLVFYNHNCEYSKFRDMGRKWYITLPLKQIERFACRLADRVVTLSEVDKRQHVELLGIPEEKIEVIPPCQDLNKFKFTPEGRSAFRERYGVQDKEIILSFMGTFETVPNIEAVRKISEVIYPAIIKDYPDTKFLIVGRNAQYVLKYKKEKMIFTGYLHGQPYLDAISASDIILVPLDLGSGIRVKILESAACSRPIVTTAKGVEGLDFVDQKEMMITPGVDDLFIKHIRNLIGNSALRDSLGRKAREKMENQYSSQKLSERFEKLYSRLTFAHSGGI